MADKKKGLTVIEKYTAISEMLNGTYKGDFSTEQALAFLTERIEQTAKKNASRSAETGEKKLTPTQQANETAKAEIVNYLAGAGRPQTVADLMKYATVCQGRSNQWVTQMLTQLRKADVVVRTEEKGKAYYSLPNTSAEETE